MEISRPTLAEQISLQNPIQIQVLLNYLFSLTVSMNIKNIITRLIFNKINNNIINEKCSNFHDKAINRVMAKL